MGIGEGRMGAGSEASASVHEPTESEKALNYIKSAGDGQRVGVVGSRDYSDMQSVTDFVNNLPEDSTVVSGHGRGVDTVAEQAADARGLNKDIHHADWNKYGKSAGFRRNPDIVNNSDVVVAFHDGTSRGTANSINLARAAGKPVFIILPGIK